MAEVSGRTERLISKIFEYQNYLKLNVQFIRELENAGGDTTQLRREMGEIEQKIAELKAQTGYRF